MATTPEDVKARVALAYNHASDFYDHSANAFWNRYGRRTVERLNLLAGASVLDLCCGTGASALPAAVAVGEKGHVLAIDLAEDLLTLGRQKAAQLGLANIEFRAGDILTLDNAHEQFDYVICVFGIFFLPDSAIAAERMWSYVRPGGTLAVTVWGSGLFEPLNTAFWDAVRDVRPELHKSFNPWDRLGEVSLVRDLFASAGLPAPEIEFEAGTHPLSCGDDALALILGSGYRGVVAQLTPDERRRVERESCAKAMPAGPIDVRTDVIYATCRKPPLAV